MEPHHFILQGGVFFPFIKSIVIFSSFVDSSHDSYWGHREVVGYLLGQGAEKDKAKLSGATALHAATRQGHLNVVKLLIDSGVECNRQNLHGDTPLYYACRHRQLDVVRFLLVNGADMVG